MPKKDRKPKARSTVDKWFVYIVRCADGSLYTGITKDVTRRWQKHNGGATSFNQRQLTLIRSTEDMSMIEYIKQYVDLVIRTVKMTYDGGTYPPGTNDIVQDGKAGMKALYEELQPP